MSSKTKNILIFTACLLLAALSAYPRAGGAGGSHSLHGSDGGGGLGGAIAWFFILPGPVKIIILLIVAAYFVYRYMNKSKSGGTDMESGRSAGPAGGPQQVSPEFFAANPGFNPQTFTQKVSTAFLAIQDAWQNKNLSKVRRWISDGVYQRFNAQFTMMNLLEQTNILSNIKIKQVRIESAMQEGDYSIITASVYFSMDDNFICKKHPEFDEQFTGDEATEYWTFIKKTGVAEKDLYNTNVCPKCGFPSNDKGGQVSQCESCGTVTYLGDYDWVLCEITQEEDYNRNEARISAQDPSLQSLFADKGADFSIQLMEDKASNAVMQYFISKVTHDLKYVRRFTSDELFATIENKIKGEDKFVYNRLYLNSVNLVGCVLANNMYYAVFNINYSSMRLKEEPGGRLAKLDDTVTERPMQLTLAKKAGAVQKTKLWSFACPSCGAPYTDTTITQCTYCDAKINSSDNDWVMTGLTPGE
jgi:uncharacterized Zn finger protein (UPF0148 family)